jgi:hypothetical protein
MVISKRCNDNTMERKIYLQSLDWKEKRNCELVLLVGEYGASERVIS